MKGIRRLSFLKKPRVWLPLLAVIVLAALLYLTVHNLNAPATGSINQTPPSQSAPPAPYSQPGNYQGRYVSFKYPPQFKISSSKANPGDLESIYFSSTDFSGRHIAVEVKYGSLADNSDVIYRQRTPSLYQQTTSRLGLEFSKKDGTEDTFFIVHGSIIASVSASSGTNNLDGEAFFVASGLEWH